MAAAERANGSPVVLASHLPGLGHFESRRYPVHAIACDGDYGYWQGVEQWWDTTRTLVNVEHDMECSDMLIAELLECDQPLCTHAYRLWWPSTHQAEPHYAQRAGLKPPAGGDWVTEATRWCDFTGIGFCKIAACARARPLERTTWQHLDCAVTRAVEGRWHVHWPDVEHYHR